MNSPWNFNICSIILSILNSPFGWFIKRFVSGKAESSFRILSSTFFRALNISFLWIREELDKTAILASGKYSFLIWMVSSIMPGNSGWQKTAAVRLSDLTKGKVVSKSDKECHQAIHPNIKMLGHSGWQWVLTVRLSILTKGKNVSKADIRFFINFIQWKDTMFIS